MKKNIVRFSILASLFLLFSCNDKDKLTEVVEVPLPSKEEKIVIGSPNDVKADPGSFELTKLPFSYDALAPAIRTLTLETHYSKHYLTYTNNLNKAILNTEFGNLPIEDILKKMDLNNVFLHNVCYFNVSELIISI